MGGGVVKAEMFGQLTSGLESAWNKLKGEGLSLHVYFVNSISFLFFFPQKKASKFRHGVVCFSY